MEEMKLPADVDAAMRREIREIPEMRRYEEKRAGLLRAGKYVEAMELSRLMRAAEDDAIERYVRKYKESIRDTVAKLRALPDAERAELDLLNTCMLLLCDLIDTFTTDYAEILHRAGFTGGTGFERLHDCGNAAKAHIREIWRFTREGYQLAFADEADALTVMFRNKAKSLLRKSKKEAK